MIYSSTHVQSRHSAEPHVVCLCFPVTPSVPDFILTPLVETSKFGAYFFAMSFTKIKRVTDCNSAFDYLVRRFHDMTFLKPSLIVLGIVCALSCGVGGDPAKSDDQANLQGTWLAQSESQNGIKKNVAFQYIFKGDTITFIDETGKEMKYVFRLDTTGSPKLLNIQSADTPPNSTPVSVAYELHGDSLTIVVAPPGLRPTEISDKNNQELISCKRRGS
jgi:uncharacterized protein (TIGR03067 family)